MLHRDTSHLKASGTARKSARRPSQLLLGEVFALLFFYLSTSVFCWCCFPHPRSVFAFFPFLPETSEIPQLLTTIAALIYRLPWQFLVWSVILNHIPAVWWDKNIWFQTKNTDGLRVWGNTQNISDNDLCNFMPWVWLEQLGTNLHYMPT